MGIISDFLGRILGPAGPTPPDRPAPVAPGPANPGPGLTVDERLRRALNRERVARGLLPLTADERLRHAAQGQADRQARFGQMTHDGLGAGPFAERIAAEGYRYAAASENVAFGQDTPEQAVADWMTSPGHRAAVLGPYTQAAGGSATGRSGRPYWTVDFARPAAR